MKITNVGNGRAPLHHVFPTEPVIHSYTNVAGEITERWYSPPVLTGKKCQRYVASRTHSADGTISTDHWFEVGGSWSHYVSKENWAGSVYGSESDPYGQQHFRRNYDGKTSKALQKKWYSQMTDFQFSHDPKECANRQENYRNFMDYEASKGQGKRQAIKAHEDRFGKLSHGDVALTLSTYTFDGYPVTRMFIMLKVRGGRASLRPHLWMPKSRHVVTCSIRRTTMLSFMKVGEEAFKEISGLSHHEKMSYLATAETVRALADEGHFDRYPN